MKLKLELGDNVYDWIVSQVTKKLNSPQMMQVDHEIELRPMHSYAVSVYID